MYNRTISVDKRQLKVGRITEIKKNDNSNNNNNKNNNNNNNNNNINLN